MLRFTSLAVVGLIALAMGCSSSGPQFPASPVPAPLSDLEAARLGNSYLHEQNVHHAMLHSALRDCDGYLLAYTTVFDADGKPPKESHLLIVKNDGSVRELRFAKE